MQILKTDADRQIVFGWANVAIHKDGVQIEDSQGDMIDLDDLEDAAYQFVLTERNANEMHEGGVVGSLVESVIVTDEKLAAWGLPMDAVHKGWWVGFKIEDPAVFAKIKDGTYKMLSIEGLALPEEV